jgi:hypothetical protein
MRVRNGRWSLRTGSALPPRSAAHLRGRASATSPAALREPTDSRSPVQVQRPQLDRISPGVRGPASPRGLPSRDPLRVSSAAAHAVMTRFP